MKKLEKDRNMNELELKYGVNPNQKPAKIYMANTASTSTLPITVLNGKPGYINFMDALNAWQLVKELKQATGIAAAASFKHVSPAGAALGAPLSDTLQNIYFTHHVEDINSSPQACAYARARGADRMSSFGDWIALSDECDEKTAQLIQPEVSDGVIAPSYSEKALEILKAKRKGAYNIVKIDKNYTPAPKERKDIYGISFEQGRNDFKVTNETFANIVTKNNELTKQQITDLTVALITLKYTQSNSVCFVKDGQAIGVGAGQQSRIHCTRLAGSKADIWHLRQHPKVLNLQFIENLPRANKDNAIDVYISEDWQDVAGDNVWKQTFKVQPQPLTAQEKAQFLKGVTGVALGSDAFFPFGDNIERAHKSGVTCIIQPGGSIRDENVIEVCNKYNIAMAFNGLRLFHH